MIRAEKHSCLPPADERRAGCNQPKTVMERNVPDRVEYAKLRLPDRMSVSISIGTEQQTSPLLSKGQSPTSALGYSITSSAITSRLCGIVRPSAFAVLRLITSSNLVGCSIGRSAGFAPRKTFTTSLAAMSGS